MRIGIYGGSFNPIHQGHTRLAQAMVSQGIVDELWLLVSPLNPLKQGVSADIAEYEHRLNMALLATEGVDGVKVSDFERHLPIPSYTINTLHELSKAYPQHDFSLVIGADNWERFPRWYHAEEIIDTYIIYIYRRTGCTIDTASLPPTVHLVNTPMYDISSTQIRDAIQKGKDATMWIDHKVYNYIKTNGLYGAISQSSQMQ